MCLEVRKKCQCGRHIVQFHLRDNIMPSEVIEALYCPHCAQDGEIDPAAMLVDNNWIIVYDMELARFMAATRLQIESALVDPAFLFDSGYAAWREMYPGEQQDILAERRDILQLAETDQSEYIRRITSWNIARVERLKAEGWRKAMSA